MVTKTKRAPTEEQQRTVEELTALVAELQAQVRELIAENQDLRRGISTGWDELGPDATDEERRRRVRLDPRTVVHRRVAGEEPPPFEPFPGGGSEGGKIDVLKLLGRRDDDEQDDEMPASTSWPKPISAPTTPSTPRRLRRWGCVIAPRSMATSGGCPISTFG